jgi:hypothetical protein
MWGRREAVTCPRCLKILNRKYAPYVPVEKNARGETIKEELARDL